MDKCSRMLVIGSLALVFAASGLRAQDQNPNNQGNGQQGTQPVQPDQPLPTPGGNPDNGEANGPDASTIPAVVAADSSNVPLSGARAPAFGVPPAHSYFQPMVSFETSVNSNGAYSSSGSNKWVNENYLLGGITLEKVDRSNELKLNYLGGRSFSPGGGIYNSTTQSLGLTDSWVGARWSGLFADQLYYASDPLFATGGLGAPGLGTGIGGVNLQPSFQANQSIFVNRSPVLNNSSVAEVDYQASPRGSFTLVGSYLLLHYYGTGLIDSSGTEAEAGYNYQLTSRDTVAVLYLFDALRFSGNLESINENVFELSYGRHIAERLTFQVAGGPDVALIQHTGSFSNTLFTWRLNSTLAYQLGRNNLGLSYAHFLTGGAGVFVGSESDQVTGHLTHQFSRTWSGYFNVGYARNSALANSAVVVATGTVDSLLGGGGLSHQMGRDFNLFLNYQGYYQVSGHAFCSGPGCGTNLVNNQFSVGIGWHPSPIAIR